MKRKSPRAHQESYSSSPRSAKPNKLILLVQKDTKNAFRRKIKEGCTLCKPNAG